MRSLIRLCSLTLLFGGWSLLLAGCGSSPPTRFYQLSALPVSDNHTVAAVDKAGMTIGIGPVEIPSYVDRPQLVTRSGQNVLDLSEFDRWAEPLQTDVKRVLIENLSQFIPHDQATIIPWDGPIPLNYQVRITITRFDFDKSGEASLSARWTIVGKDEREILILHTARFRQTGDPQDYASMVSVMSQNLKALSQDIAAALKTLL